MHQRLSPLVLGAPHPFMHECLPNLQPTYHYKFLPKCLPNARSLIFLTQHYKLFECKT